MNAHHVTGHVTGNIRIAKLIAFVNRQFIGICHGFRVTLCV